MAGTAHKKTPPDEGWGCCGRKAELLAYLTRKDPVLPYSRPHMAKTTQLSLAWNVITER
jgi:hypothetical protein